MIASSPLRTRILAGAAVVGTLAALVWPGCSSESDVTATCTPNVTQNGIRDVKDGCDQFAVCTVDGHSADPMACCSPPPKGETLADCLYGYGVVAPGGSGGGTTTTTTTPGTTTTTTPGTGGGGGAAGGGGGAGP